MLKGTPIATDIIPPDAALSVELRRRSEGQRWGQELIGPDDLDPKMLVWGMLRQIDPAEIPALALAAFPWDSPSSWCSACFRRDGYCRRSLPSPPSRL
jgi:hypothetical protein